MRLALNQRHWPGALFVATCAAMILVETYVVFTARAGIFEIEGVETYDVGDFREGGTVAQAFLMRGDGMKAVSVRLSSNAVTIARVQWTLWRGYPDQPREMARSFEGEEIFRLYARFR